MKKKDIFYLVCWILILFFSLLGAASVDLHLVDSQSPSALFGSYAVSFGFAFVHLLGYFLGAVANRIRKYRNSDPDQEVSGNE